MGHILGISGMENQMPDDGLKWFGEGFDGFPKRLPDDCVEYMIYVVDEKLQAISAIRSRLNEVLKALNELKKKYLRDYIWQRDDIRLSICPEIHTDVSKSRAAVSPHLRGRTNFGDSIADEWLIVYLLLEISKEHPDAWIRVYDTDGEFLLIEAANALPKWLNPDIAENRVWLNCGHLKVIPLDHDSSHMNMNLSLNQALAYLQNHRHQLLPQKAVELEAFHRIKDYPAGIRQSLHESLVTIPRPLAYVLNRNPANVTAAIETFYLRDPISLKPLNTKDTSTLRFPPEDFVTVSVKFTKVSFAQLRSQIFSPPPSWVGIVPRLRDEKIALGMKLACGFEMLCADPGSQNKRAVREVSLLLEDVESGEEQLPTDDEIIAWPKVEDDEKWLDIDYNDFEKELSGKTADKAGEKIGENGFGDRAAQENLRKMVSRFQDFLKDDEAGAQGVGDDVDDEEEEADQDDASSVTSGSGGEGSNSASAQAQEGGGREKHDWQAKVDEIEFEKAMHDTRTMHPWQIEESGLLEEARRLALEDEIEASDLDEDEEMRKVMDLMERELKGHNALDLNSSGRSKANRNLSSQMKKPFFGPERPPHLHKKPAVRFENVNEDEDDDEEKEVEDIGPGTGELSSDDEDYNDIDLDLAKNMLESFKGQVGMSGPAGNLMRALGVNMPRDEEHAESAASTHEH